MTALLTQILARQAGFDTENLEVYHNEENITPKVQLLAELVAHWCLEKNSRYLFAHQASREIVVDFELTKTPQ